MPRAEGASGPRWRMLATWAPRICCISRATTCRPRRLYFTVPGRITSGPKPRRGREHRARGQRSAHQGAEPSDSKTAKARVTNDLLQGVPVTRLMERITFVSFFIKAAGHDQDYRRGGGGVAAHQNSFFQQFLIFRQGNRSDAMRILNQGASPLLCLDTRPLFSHRFSEGMPQLSGHPT